MVQGCDHALLADGIGENVSGDNAVAVAIGGHIVLACFEIIGRLIHEHQSDSGFGHLLVCRNGCRSIGRDGDDDVGVLGQHGFDIGNLLVRAEVRIGNGDDLNTELFESGLQTSDLSVVPIIACVVKHQGRLEMGVLDLLHFLIRQIGDIRGCRFLTVCAGGQHLAVNRLFRHGEGGGRSVFSAFRGGGRGAGREH